MHYAIFLANLDHLKIFGFGIVQVFIVRFCIDPKVSQTVLIVSDSISHPSGFASQTGRLLPYRTNGFIIIGIQVLYFFIQKEILEAFQEHN